MNSIVNYIKVSIGNTKNTAQEYGMEQELLNIEKLINKAEKRQINLLVCGEYKKGKSSFINAFLEQNICPEDIGVATSVVSMISYGEKTKVIRHFGRFSEANIQLQTEEISFDKITQFADGSVSDIQHTILLEIQIPNEKLKNGLTIIDTPGIGSLDPRHLFLTLYALPKADIIYFITDTGEPLNNPELDFFQNRVASTGKVCRVFINKSDTKSTEEVEEIIADTRKKIKNDSIEVIPVSVKCWKEYNAGDDIAFNKSHSHCDDVCDAIQNDITKCENILSEIIRATYLNILDCLKQAIKSRKKEIEKASDIADNKTQCAQQIAEIENLKRDINNPQSDLRKQIAKIIKDSQRDVLNKLSTQSVLLSSQKFEQILKDDRAGRDGGDRFVINEINKAIISLSEDLDKEINASIEKTIDLVGREITLSEEHFEGTIKTKISPLQQTLTDKAMSMTRQSLPFMGVTMTTAMVGAAGVGLVGGLFGASAAAITVAAPYIAIPLGIAAGIAFVVKSIKDSRKQTNIAHLRTQIAPRITISLHELHQYIQNRYEKFNEVLMQCLIDSINQMEKQQQEIKSLLEQCEHDELKRKVGLAQLEAKIQFLEQETKRVQIVNTNPFRT